jgi:hypothetical protein
LQPGTIAGVAGIALALLLFASDRASLAASGQGLGAPWLLSFLLPGALAAHLCKLKGIEAATERESLRAGLLTAHAAALVLLVSLALGVAGIDWAAYTAKAGEEVGRAVREAAGPATITAALAAVVVSYVGCPLACLLGGWLYTGVTALARKRR